MCESFPDINVVENKKTTGSNPVAFAQRIYIIDPNSKQRFSVGFFLWLNKTPNFVSITVDSQP